MNKIFQVDSAVGGAITLRAEFELTLPRCGQSDCFGCQPKQPSTDDEMTQFQKLRRDLRVILAPAIEMEARFRGVKPEAISLIDGAAMAMTTFDRGPAVSAKPDSVTADEAAIDLELRYHVQNLKAEGIVNPTRYQAILRMKDENMDLADRVRQLQVTVGKQQDDIKANRSYMDSLASPLAKLRDALKLTSANRFDQDWLEAKSDGGVILLAAETIKKLQEASRKPERKIRFDNPHPSASAPHIDMDVAVAETISSLEDLDASLRQSPASAAS